MANYKLLIVSRIVLLTIIIYLFIHLQEQFSMHVCGCQKLYHAQKNRSPLGLYEQIAQG